MESSRTIPSDRDKISIVHQVPTISPLAGQQKNASIVSGGSTGSNQQTNLERLSRPLAFDKMEGLVREMQDPESGVPVRQQKMFLTSIPYAFMGYDLIEWLMDRLSIEESEALNIANQLCLHGYFFPVNDTKTLVVKDDSSLYRFQTPYYWPWQHKAPDNVEYAIYLAKRSLRNKQRHGLEDYESDALTSLHKNLKGKWDFISMQAEEQVRLAKERKKGDKIVSDSQERAYWRVHRPPPGQFTPLEPCPVPSRDRQGSKPKKKSIEDWQREVDYLKTSLSRTRMKMSQVCESLTTYWETFSDYDFFIQQVLPSNPWVSEDITFWQLNSDIVDVPTEKRVKRWSISIEELVSDQTGLQEFTNFLEKEYSHENIRFWMDVNRLRRSAHSQVTKKVREIYEEFLKPGAPCEINIDGKTMDIVQQGLKNPTRYTFDAAAEHIYTLLLKKDCYPRFVRSEHYKLLLASGIQPSHKKRFFNFGGAAKKKTSTVHQSSNQGLLAQSSTTNITSVPSHLTKRRGSDRSLTGSAHELAVIGTKDSANKVPHSHSQSNLSDIPYSVSVYRGDMPSYSIRETSSSGRLDNTNLEPTKLLYEKLEPTVETSAQAVCPWETDEPVESSVQLSVCPWDEDSSETSDKKETLPAKMQQSEITEVSERMKRSCGLRQQNTVDTDFSTKKLLPVNIEQRRSSMTITTISSSNELQQFGALNKNILKKSTTPSPTTFNQTEITSKLEATRKLSKSDLNPLSIQASDIKCDNKQTILDESSSKNLISFSLETKPEVEEQLSEMTVDVIMPCDIVIQDKDNTSIRPDIDIIDVSSRLEDELDIRQKHEKKLLILSADKLQPSQSDEIIEELSPTTDEYQEGAEFCEPEESYDNDDKSVGTLAGYVAPAPTPAPTLAPLAEIETDADDAELRSIDIRPECHQEEINKNRRKKKRSSDAKKLDEIPEPGQSSKPDESNRNAVCPWEDEDGTTTDGTFTKTYATLGYL